MPRIQATDFGAGPMPFVEIHIEVGAFFTRAMALVDSGADETIIPAEMLVPLNLDFKDLELVMDGAGAAVGGMGAGGGFEIRRIDATLKFRKWRFAEEVRVAALGALPGPLLGRQDFFAAFTIRFLWHRDPPVFDIDPVA